MRKFSPGGKALRTIMRKVMEMGMMKWVNNFFFVFPHALGINFDKYHQVLAERAPSYEGAAEAGSLRRRAVGAQAKEHGAIFFSNSSPGKH